MGLDPRAGGMRWVLVRTRDCGSIIPDLVVILSMDRTYDRLEGSSLVGNAQAAPMSADARYAAQRAGAGEESQKTSVDDPGPPREWQCLCQNDPGPPSDGVPSATCRRRQRADGAEDSRTGTRGAPVRISAEKHGCAALGSGDCARNKAHSEGMGGTVEEVSGGRLASRVAGVRVLQVRRSA